MQINKSLIKNIKRNSVENKKINIKEHKNLSDQVDLSVSNLMESLKDKSIYESALWIESNEKQLKSRGMNNNKSYNSGDILLVDLGCSIYDREFCYIHPVIVLKNCVQRIFIVPCTSGVPRKDEFGETFNEYLAGKVEDGFKRETTIQLEEVKFIDKNRVVSVLGKVNENFFNLLFNRIFKDLFECKYYEIKKLEEQLK